MFLDEFCVLNMKKESNHKNRAMWTKKPSEKCLNMNNRNWIIWK